MNRQRHWNAIYTTKGERDVSWFEARPDVSLTMLDAAGMTAESCVLDVGGGDSRLVEALLAQGLECLAVLDVSGAALDRARARIGPASGGVTWIASDVTGAWTVKPMDIWHDRAVFHFLTNPQDRASYVRQMRQTLKVGGAAIIATFALDGPDKCSGLPVVRYSPDSLAATLRPHFELLEGRSYRHETPWGSGQSFQYSRFRRIQ
jgi:SAM-dependent methyltransferase